MKRKTALITGASRGIGRAVAKRLSENGYDVAVTCMTDRDSLFDLRDEIIQTGGRCLAVTGDHSDFNFAAGLFAELDRNDFTPDVIVNNAGISLVCLAQEITADEWENLWRTDVGSVISVCREAIPRLLKKKSGSIINISSVWGMRGAAAESAYSAAKGAINSYTKALAKELAPSGIRVNAIAPGIINTDMNGHLSRDEITEIKKEIPALRIGTPDDVACAVMFLAEHADYVTGQVIRVDGGWMI